jgi:hypothetical protein
MIITTLSAIGFVSGSVELRKGHSLLGWWAVSVSASAFTLNLLV